MSNSNYLFIGAYVKVPAAYNTFTRIETLNQCSKHGNQSGNFCPICGEPIKTTKTSHLSRERLTHPAIYSVDEVAEEDEWRGLNYASDDSEYDYYYHSPLEYIDMSWNGPEEKILELFSKSNPTNHTIINQEVQKLEQQLFKKQYPDEKSFADILKKEHEQDFEICFGIIHNPEY